MTTCIRCLYTSDHPLNITFDESGLCSGCRVHEEKYTLDWDARFEKLRKITSEYKSKTRGIHDCIIPVTGARDSYYIVHVAKNLLGLKPLLVTYNKQYNTDIGIRNLAGLQTLFGCDLLTLTVDPRLVKKITRETIRYIGSIYWHVLAGQSVYPVQMAQSFKIPLIIWGAHQGLDQVGMYSHLNEVEMTRKYRKEHDLMGFEAENLAKVSDNLTIDDLENYLYPGDRELASVGVRGIYLGNYIPWNSRKQHEEMIKMYGYETSKLQSTFDSYNDVDCFHYSGLHDWVKFQKHGYGKVTDHACREIRLGQMTRDEAIRLLGQYQWTDLPSDLEMFSEWVEMPKEEILKNLKRFHKKNAVEIEDRFSPLWTDNKENDQFKDFNADSKKVDHLEKEYVLFGRGWVDKYSTKYKGKKC